MYSSRLVISSSVQLREHKLVNNKAVAITRVWCFVARKVVETGWMSIKSMIDWSTKYRHACNKPEGKKKKRSAR
jgi:hypothetical protein